MCGPDMGTRAVRRAGLPYAPTLRPMWGVWDCHLERVVLTSCGACGTDAGERQVWVSGLTLDKCTLAVKKPLIGDKGNITKWFAKKDELGELLGFRIQHDEVCDRTAPADSVAVAAPFGPDVFPSSCVCFRCSICRTAPSLRNLRLVQGVSRPRTAIATDTRAGAFVFDFAA